MAFDTHKNLAVATVATAPSPATTGISLTVAAGEGARFPVAPFNATVWPPTAIGTPVNAEVVRVTAVAADTFAIARAQEGTVARAIVPGDVIAATITAKTLTDIESGVNFPQLTTAGHLRVTGAGHFGGGPPPADSGPGVELVFTGGRGYLLSYSRLAAQYLPLQVDGATVTFAVSGSMRGMVHPSGGLSWGGTVDADARIDPGAGMIAAAAGFTQGTPAVGSTGIWLGPKTGLMPAGLGVWTAGTGSANVAVFHNDNGIVGYINTNGTATSFGTSSDARLKTDRGRHTDLDVLRRTVIHDFVWKVDGTPGRGVFAQEAATVAPFAVSVGTDERDERGNLKQPWGVDYSKYVPDLIVGWQQHDAELVALRAEVAALQTTARRVLPTPHYGTTDPRPSNRGAAWLSRVRDWLTAWWAPVDATGSHRFTRTEGTRYADDTP